MHCPALSLGIFHPKNIWIIIYIYELFIYIFNVWKFSYNLVQSKLTLKRQTTILIKPISENSEKKNFLRMEKLTNIKLRRSEATVSLTPSNVKEADGVSSKCLICLENQSRYTCPRLKWYNKVYFIHKIKGRHLC